MYEMKKINRQDMIYSLALAGISAALAIIFVTLGVYVRFTTVAFFIAAGLSLMIPLAKKYWFSSVAAFAVAGVASFFIAGSDVYAIAGFIIYFGPMALMSGIFYNLHVKWYIQLPIKLVFINGALALLYFVMGTIVVDESIMELLPYWAIAIIGSVLLIAVDLVEVFIYSRLIRIVRKVLRNREDKTAADDRQAQNVDEEPFEEELFEQDIYPKQQNDDEDNADKQ